MDYKIWNQRHSFSLREAACLWCGVNPNVDLQKITQDLKSEIQAIYALLIEWRKIMDGPDFGEHELVWEKEHRIPRDELRTFSEERGFEPAFLFNDGDQWSLTAEPPLHSPADEKDYMANIRKEVMQGRKPGGESMQSDILIEFEEMVERGEVNFRRGGQTKAAEALRDKYPTYATHTITDMIRPRYNELKDKNKLP